MTEEIEYPTAICSITEPHAKHIISGTWRQQCPGIETPANATIDQLIAESAELRQQLALAKQDADTFRAERDALKAMYRALATNFGLYSDELIAARKENDTLRDELDAARRTAESAGAAVGSLSKKVTELERLSKVVTNGAEQLLTARWRVGSQIAKLTADRYHAEQVAKALAVQNLKLDRISDQVGDGTQSVLAQTIRNILDAS